MRKLYTCQGNTKTSWQLMKEITGKVKKKTIASLKHLESTKIHYMRRNKLRAKSTLSLQI